MTVGELIQKLLDYPNQSHNVYIRNPSPNESIISTSPELVIIEDAGTADIYPHGDNR